MVNVEIPITDHGTECTDYYQIELKLSSEPSFALKPNQFESPIVLANLADAAEYNVRITRFCCNGQFSEPVTTTISTGVLDAPTDFLATAGDTQVALSWDDMPNATNYIIDRALDAGFTMSLTEIYSGGHIASVSDTGLTNGVQYFYRIKSQASGYTDSGYAYDDATPTL